MNESENDVFVFAMDDKGDIPLYLVGELLIDSFILVMMLGMSSKQSTKICKLLFDLPDIFQRFRSLLALK